MVYNIISHTLLFLNFRIKFNSIRRFRRDIQDERFLRFRLFVHDMERNHPPFGTPTFRATLPRRRGARNLNVRVWGVRW